jgi:hypothetical protein
MRIKVLALEESPQMLKTRRLALDLTMDKDLGTQHQPLPAQAQPFLILHHPSPACLISPHCIRIKKDSARKKTIPKKIKDLALYKDLDVDVDVDVEVDEDVDVDVYLALDQDPGAEHHPTPVHSHPYPPHIDPSPTAQPYPSTPEETSTPKVR